MLAGMRIGEVADAAGVTTKSLRYYERAGLLTEPARTPSGYRNYSDRVLDRVRFIRASQAAGLTLGEIREVISFRDRDEHPCSHVLDLIEGRAAELEHRIAELARLREELRLLAVRGRSLSPDACPPDLVCHILNPAPA